MPCLQRAQAVLKNRGRLPSQAAAAWENCVGEDGACCGKKRLIMVLIMFQIMVLIMVLMWV